MNRILIITQNFYPEIGSAANRMKNIAIQLSKKGFDVHVLTTEPSYPNTTMYSDNKFFNDELINQIGDNRIMRLKMRHEKQKNNLSSRLNYYTEFMLKVHHFVKKSNHLFDYVYVTSPNIFAAWGTLFFNTVQSEKILEIRDLWPDSVVAIDKININFCYPALKYLEKMMYKKSDKIVVNNPSFKEYIQKIEGNKPLLYLPNAMSKEEDIQTTKKKEFTVGYTGNLGYAQGIEQIKALSVELNKNKIHFNIIPYGVYAKDYKEFINKEKLDYIHIYPVVDRKASLNFISECHVSVALLKSSEVFLNVLPGKVIDSICAHVPIITNLDGYSSHLINKNKIGYSKKDATVSEIVRQIIYLKNNPAEVKKMSENAMDLKNKYFIWENNIETLDHFLKLKIKG